MKHAKLLQQFTVVADTLNITQAAKQLQIAQPTLTKNIHRLESHLGVPLLTREKNAIKLTEYGKKLHHISSILATTYTSAISEFNDFIDHKKRTIKIGCGFIWSNGLLIKAMAPFIKKYPNIEIIINSGETLALQNKLINGEYNFILGAIVPESMQEPSIKYIPLTEVEFGVYGRQDHPLSKKEKVPNKVLVQYPWVLLCHQEEIGSRDPYKYPIQEENIKFRVNSMDCAQEILQNTDSLISIPKVLVKNRTIDLIDIEIKPPSFNSGIMHTSNIQVQAEIEECIHTILDYFK